MNASQSAGGTAQAHAGFKSRENTLLAEARPARRRSPGACCLRRVPTCRRPACRPRGRRVWCRPRSKLTPWRVALGWCLPPPRGCCQLPVLHGLGTVWSQTISRTSQYPLRVRSPGSGCGRGRVWACAFSRLSSTPSVPVQRDALQVSWAVLRAPRFGARGSRVPGSP